MKVCDCQFIIAVMRRELTGANFAPFQQFNLWSFQMNKQISRTLAALGLIGASAASQAAAVDVSALTADIGLQAAPVVAVGGAVLLVVVAAKAFKWVRAALS